MKHKLIDYAVRTVLVTLVLVDGVNRKVAEL